MTELPRADRWRIATLNIWNRQGPWQKRLPLIRAWLAELDADVVGLQEILAMPGTPELPSQADELVAGLGWHVAYAPAWQLGGGVAIGNAIVSRYPLSDIRTLPLPKPPGLDTRSIAFARVETPHGSLPFFCTHLTVQFHLGSWRIAQVKALASYVRELAPIDGLPPILVGDFNAEPESDEIRFLRGLASFEGHNVYFADAFAACNPGALGHTYARDNTFARQAHEPSRRIDYIFVRGPDRKLRGEPLEAHVTLTQPSEGVWPSDHYAVVAEISAAPRAHDR